MTLRGKAATIGLFAAWLSACGTDRPGAESPQDAIGSKPAPYPPLPATPIFVAPDGRAAQGAPCSVNADCSSNFCWQGFCGEGAPVFDGGGPRLAGEACDRDTDCRSVFCDYGTCADPGPLRYGLACTPQPPRGPSQCGSYICVDGRCRSCQSDAECRYWKGSPTCGVFQDIRRGRACGRIVEVPEVPPSAKPAEPPPPPPRP